MSNGDVTEVCLAAVSLDIAMGWGHLPKRHTISLD